MDYTDAFHMTMNASFIIYQGQTIELPQGAFKDKILNTINFGKLKFIIDHGGFGRNGGFAMTIFLFGTRTQRDAIAGFVKKSEQKSNKN